MNTNSLIVLLKTDDIYEDIAEDVETRFDISNYELNRSLTKWKNRKNIDVIKNKLGEKFMKEFVGLRAKTYSYLIDDGSEDKKSKGYKNYVKKF